MKCAACQKDVLTGKFCSECGAPLATKPRFGDYEVNEIIGEGGMGRVFKAMQPRLKRAVCVKTLLPQFAKDEAVMTRFEREATTTAALQHPNIVSIIDVGRADDGSPYIVMEYVEGRSLRQVLRDEAPLSAARSVALLDQVLAGLAEAHAHGVVHRDLKPSNVLVTPLKDGSEHCKVLDFGIARTVTTDESDPQLTRTGMMLGTPGYMAPEQISSPDFDHRVDLYAAGVILYELLTGHRVFRAPSEVELLKKTLLEDPPKPSSRTTNNISDALDEVCLRAVSRDLKIRYASATDFREALSKAIGPGHTFMSAPSGMVLDMTPLASATSDGGSNSATNPRALLAAVLETTEPWELTRMLDAFERSVQGLLAGQATEPLGVLLRSLQDAAKDHAQKEPFKAVVTLLRNAFIARLDTVLEWSTHPEHALVSRWMIKLIGHDGTLPLLERMQNGTPQERLTCVLALRLVEPKVADLVERVRLLPPQVMKAVIHDVAKWPEADALAFATTALSSPSALHRQAALEGLDESLALRCGSVIRVRLHDPAPMVRAEALRWIFKLEDEGAVPDLIRLVARPTTVPTERRMLYRTLAHLGGSAMTPLVRALGDETDSASLTELVSLLTRTGDPRALQAVKSAAEDSKTPKPLKQLCVESLRAAAMMRPGPSV